MRIRGVSRRTQIHRDCLGDDGQDTDQHDGEARIHDHLPRVKRNRRQLGVQWVFLDRTSRPRFAKKEDMRGDEADQQPRQHEYMQHIKAGDRERSHLLAAPYELL